MNGQQNVSSVCESDIVLWAPFFPKYSPKRAIHPLSYNLLTGLTIFIESLDSL
jgi:hypothetical protein